MLELEDDDGAAVFEFDIDRNSELAGNLKVKTTPFRPHPFRCEKSPLAKTGSGQAQAENRIKNAKEKPGRFGNRFRAQGHLMLTTGDVDNNVHHGGTFRMAHALIEARKRFDFFVFPGERHGYIGQMANYWFWCVAHKQNNAETLTTSSCFGSTFSWVLCCRVCPEPLSAKHRFS